jgi:enoyl-CoA hydratase/carnithine racemase
MTVTATVPISANTVIDTGTDELLCEVRDRVAVITLNRPQARNSLSDNLTPALRRMIKLCGEDANVGALLITGAGAAFCAGGDVKGMGGKPGSSNAPELTFDQKVARLQERQRTLTGVLVNVRKPTIAALPGPAAGAGLSLALACDLRIAAESAFVTTAYVKIGLSGDYGMSWLLTRLVGTSRARELMFFGEKIDAKRCETLGLVNRVVPDDRLGKDACRRSVDSLAANEGQSRRGADERFPHLARSRSRTNGAHRRNRRSQGSGESLRRKAQAGVQERLRRYAASSSATVPCPPSAQMLTMARLPFGIAASALTA